MRVCTIVVMCGLIVVGSVWMIGGAAELVRAMTPRDVPVEVREVHLLAFGFGATVALAFWAAAAALGWLMAVAEGRTARSTRSTHTTRRPQPTPGALDELAEAASGAPARSVRPTAHRW